MVAFNAFHSVSLSFYNANVNVRVKYNQHVGIRMLLAKVSRTQPFNWAIYNIPRYILFSFNLLILPTQLAFPRECRETCD